MQPYMKSLSFSYNVRVKSSLIFLKLLRDPTQYFILVCSNQSKFVKKKRFSLFYNHYHVQETLGGRQADMCPSANVGTLMSVYLFIMYVNICAVLPELFHMLPQVLHKQSQRLLRLSDSDCDTTSAPAPSTETSLSFFLYAIHSDLYFWTFSIHHLKSVFVASLLKPVLAFSEAWYVNIYAFYFLSSLDIDDEIYSFL